MEITVLNKFSHPFGVIGKVTELYVVATEVEVIVVTSALIGL